MNKAFGPRTIFVPLSELRISPLNVRKHDDTDVLELAALIKSQSLLQNLVVIPEGEHYGVVAGGRRLRAMTHLAEMGDLEPDYPVPCLLTDANHAEGASIAENSGRTAMHPADEFEAFLRLHTAGESIEDIAAQFGVSPLVVTRRLKLANVAPSLIQLYRAGEAKLDQLMALAITDDQAQQEAIWNRTTGYMRNAHHLRAELTKNQVSLQDDKRLRFIGLAEYEAAGGPVIRDLFSNEGDGYITDVALLAKLFDAKLEAHADALRAEGWAWVKVSAESLGYGEISKYGRSKPTARELTPEEISEIETIEAASAAATKKMDAAEDESDSDEGLSFDDIEALERIVETGDRTINEIRARTEVYSERQMKKAGAMIGLSYHGVLEIHRGLIEPESKQEAAKKAAAKAGAPEPKGYSDTLMRKLSAHRSSAMSAHLLESPRVALDLLCGNLVTRMFCSGFYGAGGLNITPNEQLANLKASADDMDGSKAWKILQDRRQMIEEALPKDPADIFGWIAAMPTEDVLDLLAYCTAASINTVTGNEHARPLEYVDTAINLNMASWWQPTAKSYLGQIPKSMVIEAVAEACGAHDAKPLGAMKKGDMGKKAEELLAGLNWLPSVLRAPKAKGAKKAK